MVEKKQKKQKQKKKQKNKTKTTISPLQFSFAISYFSHTKSLNLQEGTTPISLFSPQ